MKQKKIIISTICIITISLISSNLFAFGLGFYTDYSSTIEGKYKHESDTSLFTLEYYSESASIQMPVMGAGFTIDTAIAENRLFNYRLNIGFLNMKNIIRTDTVGEISFTGWGTKFEHIFGFGLIRSKHFRLWMGPEFCIETVYHEIKKRGNMDSDGYYIYDNEHMFTITYSGGVALGFNINMDKNISLSVYGGMRVTGVSSSSGLFTYDSFEGHGYTGFVNLSILFRISDSYSI